MKTKLTIAEQIAAKKQNIIITLIIALALMVGATTFAVPPLKSELIFLDTTATVFFYIGAAFYLAALFLIGIVFKNQIQLKRLKAELPRQ